MNADCRLSFRAALVLTLIGLSLSGAPLAGKPIIDRNHWIVELNEAPTLEYRGQEAVIASIASSDAPRPLQATAPSVTGQGQFDVSANHVQAYVEFLDRERAAVLGRASARLQRELEPTAVYRHAFNGFAARMSPSEARALAETPGVRSVQPVLIHQLQLQFGPELIGARTLQAGLPGLPGANGAGTVIGIIDSGINASHQAFSDNPAQAGHTFANPFGSGQGLCSSPSVNCNAKLVGVFDYTTEGSNGLDIGGHGTHVAGIATGVEWSGGSAGVAPAANLVSWKVCYEELPDSYSNAGEPGCISSGFLQAFESAIELGVDVVNFSIGGSSTASPWANHYGRQILNLWDAGIPFVTSAGNDGPDFGSITFPAYMPWAFAVGSTTHRLKTGRRLRVAALGAWFIVYGNGPDLPDPSFNAVSMISGELAASNMLGCEPFPADTFTDRVAMLRRGDCTFETKVNNAADAGAIAVVMINNVPGDPINMIGLEDTTIPAGMISLEDSQQILQVMNALNSALTVDLPRSEVTVEDVNAQDRVSGFSSRGPVVVPGMVKPNAMAPGQSIRSAFVSSPTAAAISSGTSMASPHVAGAIAQLRQLNPSWGPDVLQSVMETTAEVEPVIAGGLQANLFERGSGRIRVDRAARAGLYLPITRSEFMAADPAQGGNPANLNLAGVLFEDCAESCTLTRTVQALRSGSWSVQTLGDLSISVSPGRFNLSSGQRQTLEITVERGATEDGVLAEGQIRLVPQGDNVVEQRLRVGAIFGAGAPPAAATVVDVEVGANRGRGTLTIEGLPELAEAVFNTSALTRPVEERFELIEDPTPDNPFSGGEGTRTFLVEVPEDTLMLWVETASEESPDIDLFVGFDANGNGQAEEAELVCTSWEEMESSERCLISNPQAGTWWIVVQNWLASAADASDAVSLDYAVLRNAPDDYSLVASGVGIHQGGDLSLQVHWDNPAMRINQAYVGAIGLTADPDNLADAGVIPIRIERVLPNQPRPTALFKGEQLPVVVPANSTHKQLFIDVPPTTFRLSVTVEGDDGVNAGLQLVEFDSLAGSAPGTPEPPPGTVVSGTGSGAGIDLAVGDAINQITPGRWHVILENPTDEEKLVYVQAGFPENGRLNAQYGLWSPRSRLIFQGIEWQRAGPGFMLWYSYDHAGLPQFYIATAAIDEDSSVWRATLERVTGNNVRQNVEVVGEVSLTTLEDDLMSFAWRLNGAHGSELMIPNAPPTCPEVDGQPFSLTGHWFSPTAPVGGTTMIVTDTSQSYVRYYYDDDGVGRWVFVSALEDELGAAGEVRDFRGFCPNCESFPMSYDGNSSAVGGHAVFFESETSATEVIEFTSAPPLNHVISLDVPIQKLSQTLSCQP
ncbi:MAG: S8 family serine peptidase [Wenzhouxiangella sp.]|nr:S8 family serine peptidase [Wenzhouxiangella sp.]